MIRTTLDLFVDEHRKLKAIAALKGTSLRELIMECVREKYEKIPNEETLEAFRQSEANEGLVEYKSVSDMLARSCFRKTCFRRTTRSQIPQS
jgi:hypothetical protein